MTVLYCSFMNHENIRSLIDGNGSSPVMIPVFALSSSVTGKFVLILNIVGIVNEYTRRYYYSYSRTEIYVEFPILYGSLTKEIGFSTDFCYSGEEWNVPLVLQVLHKDFVASVLTRFTSSLLPREVASL